MEDIDTTMERLRTGKAKVQYQTAKNLPTREEAMENFRLGIIGKGYEEKWQLSQQKRKGK